jgi:hypothetical protein
VQHSNSWLKSAEQTCVCYVSAQNKDIVQLTVGYHQLEGKRVALKKPFAILEQVEIAPGTQRDVVSKQYQVGPYCA